MRLLLSNLIARIREWWTRRQHEQTGAVLSHSAAVRDLIQRDMRRDLNRLK